MKAITVLDDHAKAAWDYIKNAPVTVQCFVGTVSLYAAYRILLKKKYKLPPGPRSLPFIGQLAAFSQGSLSDRFEEWSKEYGPVFTFYMGPVRLIVINDIDILTDAFVSKGSDFSGRPFFYSMDIFTEGSKDIAAVTYGDTWKFQRKVAVQSLRQYLTGQHMEQRVSEVLQAVTKDMETEKEPFLLRQFLSYSVFNVLHGLCFGNMLEYDDPFFKKIVKLFDDFNEDVGNGFLEDIFPPLRYWPTKKFTNCKNNLDFFNGFIQKQVEEHKAELNRDAVRCLTDTILLAQQELVESDSAALVHMTDTHTRQIIADVFGAGVDTSRMTLEWIFLVLIANPDIQARMHKEIDEVIGEKTPGKEHRAKLVYTEAVILETMRLYPVVPLGLPHYTMRDTTVGGYEIPAKTTVMVNQLSILRDSKHWEDPLTFKPERFMSPDGTKVISRNHSFIPFSMGHRSCPGESLAKLEIVYLVTGLLQKFAFALPPGVEADFTPIKGSLGFRAQPYKVVVTPR